MDTFRCLLVEQAGDQLRRSVVERSLEDLPPGDVLVRVHYSSLNYKDALAATGHRGVVKKLPHVPGIDAAGVVEHSSSGQFQAGDQVVVTGNELGAGVWGGWAERIRVPADWVVALPPPLSPKEAMVYGTAGFTAAQMIHQLQRNQIGPESGRILVTGASGGVGCLSVAMLAQLGYHVVAATGKHALRDWLMQMGAAEVVDRTEIESGGKGPLDSAVWAGAVDTVGGSTLVDVVKSTQVNGCVTACGMVAGADLPLSVYPFILRGVRLVGVTSALCPLQQRRAIWQLLAGNLRLENLAQLTQEIPLEAEVIERHLQQILQGQLQGRTVIRIP